jgi:hypothetical protein
LPPVEKPPVEKKADEKAERPSLAAPPPPTPAPPPPAAAPAPEKREPRVFTVAELGRVVGRSLERTFVDALWVEGEVSGARPAASGHVYFCMKDESEEAVVDVVLYRSQVTPRARALIKDGARVRVRGRPTYWVPRGKLQFVGDRVEPTGKGALLEALEKLKQKLFAEGLFAPEKKRPLPHDPRTIGVVTSAQARSFTTSARSRFVEAVRAFSSRPRRSKARALPNRSDVRSGRSSGFPRSMSSSLVVAVGRKTISSRSTTRRSFVTSPRVACRSSAPSVTKSTSRWSTSPPTLVRRRRPKRRR